MSLLVLEIVLALLMAFMAGVAIAAAFAPETSGSGRLSRALSALGTLAALGVVYVCTATVAPRMASALDDEVSERLDAATLRDVTVDADGRDIVLQGLVASDEERLRAGVLAATTAGVRRVRNGIAVRGDVSAPRPLSPPATTTADSTPSAAAAAQRRLDQILLNTKIEFATGSDVILSRSAPVLEEVLAVLNQSPPQLNVRIEGHTDNLGDAGTNLALSAARANAVLTWLARRGVPVSRLSAEGHGSERPVASNATAAGRARNRRVEVIAQ